MGTGEDLGARSRQRWWGVVAALVVLLAGCTGNDAGNETPTPTAPPPTATATPAPAPISLGGVVWTTSVDGATGAPDDDLEVIPYDAPAIIAAVETGPLPAGTRLTAAWTMNGVAVPEASVTVVAQTAREGGWVTFELARNEGKTWPPGELEVTITASDGTTVSGSVQIQVNT